MQFASLDKFVTTDREESDSALRTLASGGSAAFDAGPAVLGADFA